ncbi:MAG: RimK family alpha-L-glutamate ligase [Planctomycetaceae bacterium]
MRLRIATCRPLPEPDPDEDLLRAALADAGIAATMDDWRDAGRWQDAVPTVVRSTWDYIHHLDAFRTWVTRTAAAAPLWNPPDVMLDNLVKRYLLDLADRGVPVVPTLLLERGRPAAIAARAAERGWEQVVIKPAVGAGSFETHRVAARSPEAAAICDRLVADRDVLVQPYLASVDGYGERALVWIDGEFTHAVRKSPRFAADAEQVSEALPITAAERAVGTAALAPVRNRLLYARVDVAPGPTGDPLVMELELVEPSLFLLQSPPALARLVAGIRRRLSEDRA